MNERESLPYDAFGDYPALKKAVMDDFENFTELARKEQKVKAREWWIEQFNGRRTPTFYAYYYDEKLKFSMVRLSKDGIDIPASEYFHVIEKSAVTELLEKIKSLPDDTNMVGVRQIIQEWEK